MSRFRTVHSGQLVATQVAIALGLVGWGRPPGLAAATTTSAVALLAASWVRTNGRFGYEWLDLLRRYAMHRRTLPAGASVDQLLAWLRPGVRLIEVDCEGQPAGMIDRPDGRAVLLALDDGDSLLAGPAVQLPELPVAGQLVLTTQPAWQQAILAIRVPPDQPLGGTVRRVRRSLAGTVDARVLDRAGAAQAIAGFAYHTGQPGREGWSDLRLGGRSQATYRQPATGADGSAGRGSATAVGRQLNDPDLGSRPGVAVIVSSGAIRLIGADHAAVAGPVARRWPSGQRDGLATTLPLGDIAANVHSGHSRVGGAGLLVGHDRHGAPVLLRMFRSRPHTVVVAGSAHIAELLVERALAAGARQTGAAGPAPDALRPTLVTSTAPEVPPETGPWRTVLVVREALTAADADLLSAADAVLLPRLGEAEAALAASALGVPAAAEWLTRLDPELVCAISRGGVRWTRMAGSPAWGS